MLYTYIQPVATCRCDCVSESLLLCLLNLAPDAITCGRQSLLRAYACAPCIRVRSVHTRALRACHACAPCIRVCFVHTRALHATRALRAYACASCIRVRCMPRVRCVPRVRCMPRVRCVLLRRLHVVPLRRHRQRTATVTCYAMRCSERSHS